MAILYVISVIDLQCSSSYNYFTAFVFDDLKKALHKLLELEDEYADMERISVRITTACDCTEEGNLRKDQVDNRDISKVSPLKLKKQVIREDYPDDLDVARYMMQGTHYLKEYAYELPEGLTQDTNEPMGGDSSGKQYPTSSSSMNDIYQCSTNSYQIGRIIERVTHE